MKFVMYVEKEKIRAGDRFAGYRVVQLDDKLYLEGVNNNNALVREALDDISGIVITANKSTKEDTPKKKHRFVEFYRYVRPLDEHGYDPLKGVTLKFVLDYEERTIIVGYSVCNGDNFVKAEGRRRAAFAVHQGTSCITLPMPKNGIDENGSVGLFWEYVREFMRDDIIYRQMQASYRFHPKKFGGAFVK